jgi:hypothetical protein
MDEAAREKRLKDLLEQSKPAPSSEPAPATSAQPPAAH